MEKVRINVCIRPYFHDIVDTIERKPKYNKTNDRHYIRYKGKDFTLERDGSNYVVWVE
jgi:hypothetical protein